MTQSDEENRREIERFISLLEADLAHMPDNRFNTKKRADRQAELVRLRRRLRAINGPFHPTAEDEAARLAMLAEAAK